LTLLDISAVLFVGGTLLVSSNLLLPSLSMPQLTWTGSDVQVFTNAVLTLLDVSAVSFVGGTLQVSSNGLLASLSICHCSLGLHTVFKLSTTHN
jgi:hypothetical protein